MRKKELMFILFSLQFPDAFSISNYNNFLGTHCATNGFKGKIFDL